MTLGIGTDSVDLDPTHITLDIGVTVAMILTEVAVDPFTCPCVVAHCMPQKLKHIPLLLRTHHTADLHHAEISPEMTVDLGHTNPTNTITKPHKDHLPVHIQHPGSLRDRKYKQITIDDPPSEYYNSDEQESDSEDDLN